MSDEKDKKSDPKAIVEQFLGTLGLVDIVLGSLAVYWAHLREKNGFSQAFPSTGIDAADGILLLTAVALVGKMVVLITLVIIAICRACAMASDRYRKPIEDALGGKGLKHGNYLDFAEAYLLFHKPELYAALQQIRSQAILAWGAALLSVAYVVQYRTYPFAGWLAFCACVFVLLGVTLSLDFVGQLGRMVELISKAASLSQANEPK